MKSVYTTHTLFKNISSFKQVIRCHGNFHKFQTNFRENHVSLSTFQKLFLVVGSSLQYFLKDSTRLDLLACFAELTSTNQLQKMLLEMQEHPEGKQILWDRPLLNPSTICLAELRKFPENTLGYEYAKFLDKYGFSKDEQLNVKFMDNIDTGYLMTRYRQCHDFVHTITNLPPNKMGEISLKSIEAYTMKIPLCYIAASMGPLLMNKSQMYEYRKNYLPWIDKIGQMISVPFLFIYWEKRLHQDINELRNEIGIIPFNCTQTKKDTY